MRRLRIALALLAAGCGCLTGPAQAEFEFLPLLDVILSGNTARYEAAGDSTSAANSGAGNLYLSMSPNFRFTEVPGLWITPTLEFEYSSANNLLPVEDQLFLFNKKLDLYLLLGANYAFNRVWSLKAKGFGRLENVVESADEDLNTGLYNYRDAGAWLETAAAYTLGVPMRTKLGFKAYARKYPNFTPNAVIDALAASGDTVTASQLPKDLHEKDCSVSELWLRQELSWGGLPVLTNLELRVQGLAYTEMPVIIEDGSYDFTTKRNDAYVTAAVELPWMPNPYHQLELDLEHTLHHSNQGYYDQGAAEPVFLGGYYDFSEYGLRLLYTPTIPWKVFGFPAKGAVSLGVTDRTYLGRPSMQTSEDYPEGAYNFSALHRETVTDIGLTLRQPMFDPGLSLLLSAHFINQRSNTDVDDNAPYNFKYNTFTLGLAYSY